MSYRVLARKYRPQQFADVVGQEPVVRTLRNALETGRVHHAYIFSGIRGIGKTTTARLLARALNCEKGPTSEPCGTCPACEEVTAGRSLDSLEIDAASNRGIDEIKGLIQNAQYSPSRDRYKVFIIDEFHMLTREAFNALLKTLEEPPPNVVFILATTELEKVPATILSRCLLLGFRPVAARPLCEHLLDIAGREKVKLDAGAAELIVRKAGGSLRDAQSTLDRVIALSGEEITRQAVSDVLGLVDAETLLVLLESVLEGDGARSLGVVAQVAESGADLHGFLEDLVAEARAVLLTNVLDDDGASLGLPEEELAHLRRVAVLGSLDDHHRLVDILLDAGPRLRHAQEPRFLLEALVVRLSRLARLEPLQDVLRRLDEGGSDLPPVAPPSSPASDAALGPSGSAASGPSARNEPSTKPRAEAVPAAPAAPPGPAGDQPLEGGRTWRDRMDAVRTEPQTPEPPPEECHPVVLPDAPPVGRTPTDSMDAFRGGLPKRVRARLDQGVLRRAADGLLVLLPAGREEVAADLESDRFHLMAAASEAHGQPVPVVVRIQEDLLGSPLAPGDLEGLEFSERRLRGAAEASPSVRALIERFDGKVTSVEDPDAPGARQAG